MYRVMEKRKKKKNKENAPEMLTVFFGSEIIADFYIPLFIYLYFLNILP